VTSKYACKVLLEVIILLAGKKVKIAVYQVSSIFFNTILFNVSRDSAVGIATGYGLDD
jgi:hypothetical protein